MFCWHVCFSATCELCPIYLFVVFLEERSVFTWAEFKDKCNFYVV